jgi:acetyl esterase/lipase
MTFKRIIVVIFVVIIAIGASALISVAGTSAEILGYHGALAWRREPVLKTPAIVANMDADVYTTSRSRSLMLLIHGVNDTGKRSPEVKPIAEGFADAGFRVVVPEFPRLTRQNVTPEDIDDVVKAFQWLGGDAGILCASYGCGPALIAASRPEIRDHVRFVVPFGGYFDLTEQLRFIIVEQQDTAFAYSKWRYMGANADLLETDDDRRQLLALAEERGKGSPEEWRLSSDKLPSGARAMAGLFEARTATEFEERLALVPRLRERIERLSPSRYVAGIRGRLIIVHIASDPSIPSSQSVRLADAAQAQGLSHSLTLLNMYGHTRPVWPPFGLRSLFTFYAPESIKFGGVVNQVLRFVD